MIAPIPTSIQHTSTSGDGLRLLPIALALFLVVGLAVPGVASSQKADGQDTISVLDSVFSAEQALQGRQVFDMECALCHAPGEFTGTTFQLSWTGRPVGALFTHIRMTMPQDRPGSLSEAQYAALVAYILELNGYPAGDSPLPTDVEALSLITVERNPDDG